MWSFSTKRLLLQQVVFPIKSPCPHSLMRIWKKEGQGDDNGKAKSFLQRKEHRLFRGKSFRLRKERLLFKGKSFWIRKASHLFKSGDFPFDGERCVFWKNDYRLWIGDFPFDGLSRFFWKKAFPFLRLFVCRGRRKRKRLFLRAARTTASP